MITLEKTKARSATEVATDTANKEALFALWQKFLEESRIPRNSEVAKVTEEEITPSLIFAVMSDRYFSNYKNTFMHYFPRTWQLYGFISRLTDENTVETEWVARRKELFDDLLVEFKYFEVDTEVHKRLFRKIESYRNSMDLDLSVDDLAELNLFCPDYGIIHNEIHPSNVMTSSRLRERKRKDVDGASEADDHSDHERQQDEESNEEQSDDNASVSHDTATPSKKRADGAKNDSLVERLKIPLDLDDAFVKAVLTGCHAYTGTHYSRTSNSVLASTEEGNNGQQRYKHVLIIKLPDDAANSQSQSGRSMAVSQLEKYISLTPRQKYNLFESVESKQANGGSRWRCLNPQNPSATEDIACLPRGMPIGSLAFIKVTAHVVVHKFLDGEKLAQGLPASTSSARLSAPSGAQRGALADNDDNADEGDGHTWVAQPPKQGSPSMVVSLSKKRKKDEGPRSALPYQGGMATLAAAIQEEEASSDENSRGRLLAHKALTDNLPRTTMLPPEDVRYASTSQRQTPERLESFATAAAVTTATTPVVATSSVTRVLSSLSQSDALTQQQQQQQPSTYSKKHSSSSLARGPESSHGSSPSKFVQPLSGPNTTTAARVSTTTSATMIAATATATATTSGTALFVAPPPVERSNERPKRSLEVSTTIQVPAQAFTLARQSTDTDVHGQRQQQQPLLSQQPPQPVATTSQSPSALASGTETAAISLDFLQEMAAIEDQLPDDTRAMLEQARQQQQAIEAERQATSAKAKVALQAFLAKQQQQLEQLRVKNARLDGVVQSSAASAQPDESARSQSSAHPPK